MGQGIRIKGRRIRFRFFIFLIIIIISPILISKLGKNQPTYASVEYGEMTIWEECKALIIREEKVYSASSYEKVDYFVAQGDEVDKDTLVAMLYKRSYRKELVDNLYQVKHKISDYQQKNIIQDVLDKDYDRIESNINDSVRLIQSNIQLGMVNDMERKEKELRSLLLRRQELLDKKVSPDNYLKQLYAEEERLSKDLEEWKVEIIAPEAGIVSFHLDGLENMLNPGIIDYLTIDGMWEYESSLGNKQSYPGEYPFLKIVNPERWYLACEILHNRVFYQKGDLINVKFLSYGETYLEGTVYKISRGTDSTMVILELTEGIDAALEGRNISIEIGNTTEGLMVPTQAIITNRDGTGVKVISQGETSFVPIKIKVTDGNQAIIEKQGDAGNISLHDRVIVK